MVLIRQVFKITCTSVVFNSGQKMALNPMYFIIVPIMILINESLSAPSFGHY